MLLVQFFCVHIVFLVVGVHICLFMEVRGMKVIKQFSSAWGASVMGFSAYTTMLWLAGLHTLARMFAYFLVIFASVVIVMWLLKVIFYPSEIWKEFKHPIKVNFLPTVAVAILVSSSVFLNIFQWKGVAYWGWWIGMILVFLWGVLIGYDMFVAESVDLEHVNYSWLIPPVAAIVVTLLGIPVSMIYGSKVIATISLWFFGMGMMLFLFVGGFVFMRMISHRLPPCPMAPSFWIMLGPIGVGTLDLLGMTKMASVIGMPFSSGAVWAVSLWGFGLWALTVSVMLTIHYHFKDKIPYGLGWWAYIFPLGAYTNASFKLYSVLNWKPMLWVAYTLAVLLTFFFIRTFVYTLLHIPAMFGGEG